MSVTIMYFIIIEDIKIENECQVFIISQDYFRFEMFWFLLLKSSQMTY